MAPLPHSDRRQNISGFDRQLEQGNSSSADRQQSQGVGQGPRIWQGQGFAPPGYVPAGLNQQDEQRQEPEQGTRVWHGQGFPPPGYVPPRSPRGRGGASQRGSGFTSTRGGAASRSRGQLGPRAEPPRDRTFLAGPTIPARGSFIGRSRGRLASRGGSLGGRGSQVGPTNSVENYWDRDPRVRIPVPTGQSYWNLEEQERLYNLHLDPQTGRSWFRNQANEENQLPENFVAAASTNPLSQVHKRKRSQSAVTARGDHDRAEEHAVNKKQRSAGDFVMNLPIRAAPTTLVIGVSDSPPEQEHRAGDNSGAKQAGSELNSPSRVRHQASGKPKLLSLEDYLDSKGI